MKNMKKVVAMILAVMMIASFCACSANFHSSSDQSNTQTCNGISMTTTTSTVNGKTETTVEYTDADGNVLDPAIGAAAYEAAKNGDQHPLETAMAAQATEAPAAEATEAPAQAASQEETISKATITFDNETGVAIDELYFALSDADSWGTNLADDKPVEDGRAITFPEGLTYSPSTMWDVKIVTADGESITFNGVDLSVAADAMNITLTFTQADGAFNMHIG